MNQVFAAVILLCICTSCGSALYPGSISLPQLKEQGDVQIAGNASLGALGTGVQAQAAYALSDRWGVQGSFQQIVSVFRNPRESPHFPTSAKYGAFEAGLIRILRPSGAQHSGNSYLLQAGLGHSRTFSAYDRLSLDFSQNQIFVQGQSRHEIYHDLMFSVGLRVGASQLNWINEPDDSPYYSTYRRYLYYPTLEYLEFRRFFWMVTPIFQAEYALKRFVFTGSIQSTHVVNQIDWRPPATTLNFGIRWQLKG